jgi:ADP-ribosylglycohydrolase
MRIAPVALYFNGDPDAMFESVMDASLMTHRDIRSLAGAMAVAHAVRRLAAGALRDPSIVLWLAADVAREEERIAARYAGLVGSLDRHRSSLSRSLAHVESLLDLPREQALAALVEEANRHGAEPSCKRATMGFPPACIPSCLYVLMTTDSFEEALIEVVNLGGDTDTTGAILGALAGAHYGVAAIPDRWLDRLQNRDAIDLRASALARRSAAGLDIPDLIHTEHALSAQEGACREQLLALAQNGGDLGANRRRF